jgi:hypothetical protein
MMKMQIVVITILAVFLAATFPRVLGDADDAILLRAIPPIRSVSLVNASNTSEVLLTLYNESVVDLALVGQNLNLWIELLPFYSQRVGFSCRVVHEVNSVVVGNYTLLAEPFVWPVSVSCSAILFAPGLGPE